MDPHAVLGLTPDATLEQAAEAYKRLAKEWHPDVMGYEGLARMTELNVAYDLLRAEHRPGAAGRVGRAAREGHGDARRPRPAGRATARGCPTRSAARSGRSS